MKEIILLKEGEIALKGLNKRTFEESFIKNLRHRLKPLGKFDYTRSQSMIYCEPRKTLSTWTRLFSGHREFSALLPYAVR